MMTSAHAEEDILNRIVICDDETEDLKNVNDLVMSCCQKMVLMLRQFFLPEAMSACNIYVKNQPD